MGRDGRFWRNVAIVAILHVAIAVVLVGWTRETTKLDQTEIVWMMDGLTGGAVAESSSNADSKQETSRSEQEPVLSTNDEREEPIPVPTPTKSDIQLPVPTPSPTPVKTPTPEPENRATPSPKPAPKRAATPTPKSKPKKKAAAKSTPVPSPKDKVKTTEKKETKPEPKEKETTKTTNATGTGSSRDKSNATGSGSGGSGSEYSWYGKMLYNRFNSAWIQPTTSVPAGAKMSVLVRIRIEKDGRISKFNLVRPSGNVVVDESVAAVAKKVTRVDPLPSGLGRTFYDVNINFELNPTR